MSICGLKFEVALATQHTERQRNILNGEGRNMQDGGKRMQDGARVYRTRHEKAMPLGANLGLHAVCAIPLGLVERLINIKWGPKPPYIKRKKQKIIVLWLFFSNFAPDFRST